MLAHWIICAVADFPIPKVKTTGLAMTFNLLPVAINVLYAELGSSLKPLTASWAAKSAVVALTANSLLNCSIEIVESGSMGSCTIRAAAESMLEVIDRKVYTRYLKCKENCKHKQKMGFRRTVVHDNGRDAQFPLTLAKTFRTAAAFARSTCTWK